MVAPGTIDPTPYALTADEVACRNEYIGGQAMAALAGVSRWAVPIDIYIQLVGLAQPRPSTPHQTMGHVMEQVVADLFTLQTGIRLHHARRRQHRDHLCSRLLARHEPWLGGHIDRFGVDANGERLVFEAKWSEDDTYDEWGPTGSDQVPPGYKVQVLHYLLVSGRDVGYLAVLFGRGVDPFRWYRIEREPDTIQLLRHLGRDFWHDNVLARTPPPPDGSQAYSDYLRDRWRADQGSSAVATPEQQLLARQLAALQHDLLEHELARDRVQQQLQRSMRDLARLELPDGAITWREQASTYTDWRAVAQDGLTPEAATRTKPTRTWRVPWPTTTRGLEAQHVKQATEQPED